MARPHIHYEAAFQDFMRAEGIPFVPVNEARKAIFGGRLVKSFDFLVYGAHETTWLADVKGRRFPYDHDGRRRYWENWVTGDDLESLERWQDSFGEAFTAAFVFAYWLCGAPRLWPETAVHPHAGRYYGFLAVDLGVYRAHCRRRSPRWDTFTMPRATFRRLARPVTSWWSSDVTGRGVY